MTTTINRTFTTPGNYTYDSGLIEVTGGVAKLKDAKPSTCSIFDSYVYANNATYGDGTLTRTLVNATISGGELDCTGGTVKYATLPADNFAALSTEIKLDMLFRPDFNNNPGETTYLFQLYDGTNNNNFFVSMSSTGSVSIRVYDNVGGLAINQSFVKGDWVLNQQYRIVVFVKSGDSRCYLDEVSKWSNATTFTRGSSSTIAYVGANSVGSFNGHFKIAKLYVGNSVGSYETDTTYPTARYSAANPTIEWNETFFCTDINTLSDTTTETGSDAVKYALERNGANYYWDGGAVASSSGYAQSNTSAELTDEVLDEFTSGNRYAMKFIVYLHSDDGSTTPEIDLLSFNINASLENPDVNTLVNLEGYVYDAGQAASGVAIKVRPYEQGKVSNGIFHRYEYETIDTTDANGHFSGFVYYLTDQWEIKIGKQSYRVSIPDQEEVNLKDLTLTLVED